MSSGQQLYQRWINELWAGEVPARDVVTADFVGHWPDRDVHGPAELQAVVDQTRNMLEELMFAIDVGPLVDGDLVAGRWVGTASGEGGPILFAGNDILRVDDGRVAEYWTGSSTA